MLDLILFRNPEGIAKVKEIQKKRFKSEELVDQIADLIEQQRKVNRELCETKKRRTDIATAFKNAKIQKKDLDPALLAEKDTIEPKIKELGDQFDQLDQQIKTLVKTIGNFVHPEVVVEKDEAFNKVMRVWQPDRPAPTNPKQHQDLFKLIDGYDMERGSKVAGHRAYYLKNMGVRLNQAIRNYGIDFLMKRNYTLMETPLFMYKHLMAKTAQLSQFDEELYHIDETNKHSSATDGEDAPVKNDANDKYLIATSEQPISCYYSGETLNGESLPQRFGCFSTCFRKEAGAAGRDNAGIFRVHQFEKIEQFVLTTAEDSDRQQMLMLTIAEDFYRSLEIPYQIVDIVSGALNNAAVRKFDLEGYFPGSGKNRELVSCSNCTDYQSRELDIKYTLPRAPDAKTNKVETRYVHLLNSTLCANTRTLCVILENYQTDTGIEVPEPLQSYMNGLKFIPFV